MSRLCVVTGGGGFIGRHLCQELVATGYEVRVLDRLDAQVHGDSVGDPPPVDADERRHVQLIRGDVRDPDAVRLALEGAHLVVHLAAQVGVGQSMYEIDEYVGTNDHGTAVLLQALIDHPVERIVVASSMSVYGEGRYRNLSGEPVTIARRRPADLAAGNWDFTDTEGRSLVAVPTDETKPTDLASIYALTKYVQERAVLLFAEAYGIDAVALRLFNVFGPGQALSNPYTGVLANFASRLAAGAPPTIFEDGHQKRDFVHVRDVARAFRLALETPEAAGRVINIGSGRAYSIREVADLLAAAMGRDIDPEILARARSGDIRNCFADITLAREVLGYEPRLALEDSLDEFVAWVAGQRYQDKGAEMRRALEERGLVS